MPNISIRAVILATLAVLGIDILSGTALTQMFGGPGWGTELSKEEIRRAYQVLMQDVRYVALGLLLGTASTVLGGYLAARLARSMPYYNALAFGVLGILVNLIGSGEVPAWVNIVALGLALPAALLGGHIAKLQMSRPAS